MRMLIAAAAVFAACVAVAQADICAAGTKFIVDGATFDVTNLMRSGDTPDYIVTDGDIPCTPAIEENYTYIFDICGNVNGNNKPSQCSEVTGPAMQFNPDNTTGKQCNVIGRNGAFSLINEADPTMGIVLTYTGGDQCHHYGAPNRQTSLVLGCANIAIPTPTVANEPEHCHYYVKMDSIYGCPLECPVGGENRDLCSAHGICAWDQTNSKARCFCDDGYTGTDCNSQSSGSGSGGGKGSSGAVIGLLVTVLLVAVVLGVVLFFVIRMLRAYRQDAHNYMAMHNQDLGTQDL